MNKYIGTIVFIAVLISLAFYGVSQANKAQNVAFGINSQATDAPDDSATDAPTDAPAQIAEASTPHVIFKMSGSGMHTTQKFDITSQDWDLKWSYDCSSLGFKGNFIVAAMPMDGDMINQLGAHDQGTEHFHSGPKNTYLYIDSECNWNVEVLSY